MKEEAKGKNLLESAKLPRFSFRAPKREMKRSRNGAIILPEKKMDEDFLHSSYLACVEISNKAPNDEDSIVLSTKTGPSSELQTIDAQKWTDGRLFWRLR